MTPRLRPRPVPAWTLVCLLAVVLTAPGCGTSQDEPRWGTDLRGRRSAELTLRVENRQLSEATLYALSGADRLRLGTVNSMAVSRIRVPWRGFGTLQVEINILGGGRFVTAPLDAGEGYTLNLTIADPLEASELYR